MIYDFAFTWAVVALIVLGATACCCAVHAIARWLDFRRWEQTTATDDFTAVDRAAVNAAEAILRDAARAARAERRRS